MSHACNNFSAAIAAPIFDDAGDSKSGPGCHRPAPASSAPMDANHPSETLSAGNVQSSTCDLQPDLSPRNQPQAAMILPAATREDHGHNSVASDPHNSPRELESSPRGGGSRPQAPTDTPSYPNPQNITARVEAPHAEAVISRARPAGAHTPAHSSCAPAIFPNTNNASHRKSTMNMWHPAVRTAAEQLKRLPDYTDAECARLRHGDDTCPETKTAIAQRLHQSHAQRFPCESRIPTNRLKQSATLN